MAALAAVSLTFAAPRSVQQAQQIAGRFVVSSNATPIQRIQRATNAATPSQPMRLAYTQQQAHSTTPALYVFNAPDHGYVLVSADDHTRVILGYSDTDIFNPDSIPDNLRFWLCMYADEIASLPDETSSQIPAPPTRVAAAKQTTYPTIEPLLGDIAWGQDEPYNNLCPTLNGTRCVTGCVATAAAQIMYYHKYPAQGTGSNSYTWNNKTLSADFNTTYDWDNMLPTYKSSDVSVHADAVAKLMYHVGVSCNMNYGLNKDGGSGSNNSSMSQALIQNFKYDKGIRTLPKDYMDETDMLLWIANDLSANRPIFMSGRTINDEGHAFVLDGMQSNGFVHINWGWNGYCNSYFAISALTPEDQGTGGAASGNGYTESVTAYIGIQPDVNGDAIPTITADSVVYVGDDRIAKSDELVFSIYPFFNMSPLTAQGEIVCYIYEDNAYYGGYHTYASYDLEINTYYTNPRVVSSTLSSLEAGDYEISIGVLPTDGNTIYPIYTKVAHGERRFPVIVTADSIFIGKGTVDIDAEADVNFTHSVICDYTDYVNVNMLYVSLLTDDYNYSDGQQTAGSVLQLTFMPSNRTSIVGTYQLGGSTAYGTLYNNESWTSLDYVVDGNYISKSLSRGLLTVTMDADGNYVFAYDITAGKYSYSNTLTLPASKVKICRYLPETDNFASSTLQNKSVTALASSDVSSLVQTFTSTSQTTLPYLIQGVISNISSNAAIMKQNGYANFHISDDGTETNRFYCYKTHWLNNKNFTTGSEIKAGDHIVLCTPLQNYNGLYPRAANGYIYQHVSVDKFRDIDIHTHIDPALGFYKTTDTLYCYWWESGENGQLVELKPDTANWWTATINTAVDSIACVIVNQDVISQGWNISTKTEDSPFFTSSTCFELTQDATSDTTLWTLTPTDCDFFTALPTISPETLNISVNDHTITISSPCSTPIRIYNITGQLVYSQTESINASQQVTYTLPASGIYIIHTMHQTTKITIP